LRSDFDLPWSFTPVLGDPSARGVGQLPRFACRPDAASAHRWGRKMLEVGAPIGPSRVKIIGETSKAKALRPLLVCSNSFLILVGNWATGKDMPMLAGHPRAGCGQITFDQPAGYDNRHTALTTPATSACKLPFVRLGHKLSLQTRLEQACPGRIARLMLCRWIFPALVLFSGSLCAEAECVDAAMPSRATVSITRLFDEGEIRAEPDLLGTRGTGWFFSRRSMVTVAHVAQAMHLSAQDWKDIEIRDGENKQSIPVRILRVVGAHSEKIAVLELANPFPGAQFLRIRTAPLVTNERVMSVAYPGDRLRVADGRFVEYRADDKFAGTALLELYDGNDRLVLDHGASGAPVLDCEGRVVAVVSNLLTRTMQFLSREIRISTAWDVPNVVSVPIQVLEGFTAADLTLPRRPGGRCPHPAAPEPARASGH
jgi:hypothetical protein